MNPYFTLDNKNQSTTFIMLQLACNDARLKYTSGKKVRPYDWDKTIQRTGVKATDKRLNDLESWTKEYILKCNEAGIPVLKESVKKYLIQKDGKTEKIKSQKGSFFIKIDQLIKLAKNKEFLNPKTGKEYSDNTIISWESTRTKLFAFDPTLSFELITIETYKAFIGWCNDNDHSQNSTGSYLRVWKTLSKHTLSLKYHTSLVHKDDEIKNLSNIPYAISLSDDEIGVLINHNLRGKDEIIRDRFVINLFLGLRISDFKNIDESFIENDIIKISNKKTGANVAIPVSIDIKDIIQKYNGKLPKQYTKSHVNNRIKIISKNAGIKGVERFVKKTGGKDVHVEKQRWEMISCHTARRTAATNMQRSGITDIRASKVLGMSLNTLKRYNKVTAEQNAQDISQNDFFQKRRGK